MVFVQRKFYKTIISLTGSIALKAPNQQNSQLVLFSDKGIGALPVAELWGGGERPKNVIFTAKFLQNKLVYGSD